MKISLIVPCYNEENNVSCFFEACKNAFLGKTDSYEIIFINDGSKDNTWNELKKLHNLYGEKIKLINFSRNFGKESAMYAGFCHAEGDYVTVIDADLQQRPEIAWEMVDFLDNHEEYDCVAAFQEKRNEGKFLSFCKKCFYKIINRISDIDFKSGASDFRTFRKKMADSIIKMNEYYRFSKGIFSWVGFNTYYMPYRAQERNAGKTSWSFIKLTKYAINGFVSFSTFPLKVSAVLGSVISSLSLIYMFVIIIQKLFFGINVEGYATIVVLILLLGGIQLISLGVIGEYISHIYIEGKKRPIYIEKDYLPLKGEKDD